MRVMSFDFVTQQKITTMTWKALWKAPFEEPILIWAQAHTPTERFILCQGLIAQNPFSYALCNDTWVVYILTVSMFNWFIWLSPHQNIDWPVSLPQIQYTERREARRGLRGPLICHKLDTGRQDRLIKTWWGIVPAEIKQW